MIPVNLASMEAIMRRAEGFPISPAKAAKLLGTTTDQLRHLVGTRIRLVQNRKKQWYNLADIFALCGKNVKALRYADELKVPYQVEPSLHDILQAADGFPISQQKSCRLLHIAPKKLRPFYGTNVWPCEIGNGAGNAFNINLAHILVLCGKELRYLKPMYL